MVKRSCYRPGPCTLFPSSRPGRASSAPCCSFGTGVSKVGKFRGGEAMAERTRKSLLLGWSRAATGREPRGQHPAWRGGGRRGVSPGLAERCAAGARVPVSGAGTRRGRRSTAPSHSRAVAGEPAVAQRLYAALQGGGSQLRNRVRGGPLCAWGWGAGPQ